MNKPEVIKINICLVRRSLLVISILPELSVWYQNCRSFTRNNRKCSLNDSRKIVSLLSSWLNSGASDSFLRWLIRFCRQNTKKWITCL